jgi:hypothetical protein
MLVRSAHNIRPAANRVEREPAMVGSWLSRRLPCQSNFGGRANENDPASAILGDSRRGIAKPSPSYHVAQR